jgi:hypothetical protein
MPAEFTCPHCAATTLVADEFAGQAGKCAHCGRDVEIPYFRPALPGKMAVAPSATLARWFWPTALSVVTLLALIALGWGLVRTTIPVWRRATIASARQRSQANLQAIGRALRAYEAEHGQLPVSYVSDAAGQPLYSWRVLLLPYLGTEERRLYDRLQKGDRWDSWQNRGLLSRTPRLFVSAFAPEAADSGETHYFLFVGPKTAFPSPKSINSAAITDAKGQTILIVEGVVMNTHWAEPVDLETGKISFRIADGSAAQIGGLCPDGAYAYFADDTVGLIPNDAGRNILSAMSTIAGGEPVPSDAVER